MIAELREQQQLDAGIQRVLANDACSGCGACTLLDSGLEMRESAGGYLRPLRVDSGVTTADAAKKFSAACPGVRVRARRESPSTRRQARSHQTMGAYVGVWKAWATDPELRFQGSSGGVLSALSTWLLESGQAARVTGAAAGTDPRRSVPVTITSRAEALAAAGSRYTPVAALANRDVLERDSVVVGKPCEASAISELAENGFFDGPVNGGSALVRPLVLSFFCAGTPSALATDKLLEELLGAPEKDDPASVDQLWYRGHGWPGEFTAHIAARSSEPMIVSADYDDSWGRVLGPTTQWRCKVCADGVGERADIVAADYWDTDDRGYPSFAEGDGFSALIARTPRGLETIRRAAAEGVIQVEEIAMDSLAAVQPLQRDRRRFLAARLLGSRLAGRRVPKYRGFGLLALSVRSVTSFRVLRQYVRAARGTYRRVRAQ